MTNMKKITTLITALLITLPTTLWAQPELTGTPDELSSYLATAPGRVAIMGESELIVPADEMKITYAIKTKRSKLEEALSDNKRVRSEITSHLIKNGIMKDQISSEKFSSTPKQGLFGDRPKSYEVINKLLIRIKTDAEFAIVATVADQWDEAYYLSAEANQTDKDKQKRRAIQQALEDATAKKTVYENALGIKLRLQQVYDAHTMLRQPRMRVQSLEKKSVSVSSYSAMPEPADVDSDTGGTFGSFTYNARVQVEYVMER